MLVICVLVLLCWFSAWGSFDIDTSRFNDFWGAGSETVISMVGVVVDFVYGADQGGKYRRGGP